jgi:2-C-methyl-D-erythritol 4-phosphate cytidylyltransferase
MTIALIVAAGSGQRLGAGRPKALVDLAGRPMLQWSIDALAAMDEVTQIVVALPPGTSAPPGTIGVEGGATRSQSVRRALDAAGARDGDAGGDDTVIVHDAARPLLTSALAREVTRALERDEQAQAAIAAAPVSDTIKRAEPDGAVSETLQRAGLWAVQTPQVFRRAALERALAEASDELLSQATDDAWLIERAGGVVHVIGSDPGNLKITTPEDLRVAELLLTERRSA